MTDEWEKGLFAISIPPAFNSVLDSSLQTSHLSSTSTLSLTAIENM